MCPDREPADPFIRAAPMRPRVGRAMHAKRRGRSRCSDHSPSCCCAHFFIFSPILISGRACLKLSPHPPPPAEEALPPSGTPTAGQRRHRRQGRSRVKRGCSGLVHQTRRRSVVIDAFKAAFRPAESGEEESAAPGNDAEWTLGREGGFHHPSRPHQEGVTRNPFPHPPASQAATLALDSRGCVPPHSSALLHSARLGPESACVLWSAALRNC